MDSIIFKVIFKAVQQFDNKNLTLNFQNLPFEKPLTIPSKLILKLKELSKKTKNIIFFQNIEEVMILGNKNHIFEYNYYLVLLFTLNSSGEKQGYLIGNLKNEGNLLIGIWPFNKKVSNLTQETIINKYNDLLENTADYRKICVISH